MNNPAFDIPEREMLIIIDSNAESTRPEVNWAECQAQVNTLFKNAYSETKCFIARAKVRFSQHMRSISRIVLQCFSSPRLQSKKRASRSRRSHSASRSSGRSAKSSDSDSSPSDPLPLHNLSLSLDLNLSSLFSLFSMAHTSIDEVIK